MIAVGACIMEYLCAPSTKGIMTRLIDWMGMPCESVVHTFAYVAAMHDIGKAHPDFQPYPGDSALKTSCFRHEQFGAIYLRDVLWKDRGWDSYVRSFFSGVVRVHHQGKGIHESHKDGSDRWGQIRKDLENRMWELFKPIERPTNFSNMNGLGVLLSGALIICDWVASSKDFAAESLLDADDETLLPLLQVRAREILSRYGLIGDDAADYPKLKSFTDLFPEIPERGMRPLQKLCQAEGERDALLTIIEAPMGEGKTEAALYLAGRLCEKFEKRGVYMALPTAATSNQMVSRVRRMLEVHQMGKVRLLHSMAWLIDDNSFQQRDFNMDETDDAQSIEDWLRPLRRGMLSENAVGTVDQAMAAALRIKYGFLRLEGLANKVLIIDEIHAYDVFMSTIIARLLEWCASLRIPVILLSATLQNRQKLKYLKCYGVQDIELNEAYPLVTQVTKEGMVSQMPVSGTHMHGEVLFYPRPLGCDVSAIAELAFQRTVAGGCLCVMLNTVRQAQAVYRALKKRGETQVMLFHARFTAQRRAEIEKECLWRFGKGACRPERMILVCTQVVEQSLDVDFDAMITQLAPMDLLLQRAGRVHRHEGNRRPAGMEKPVVEVLVPSEDTEADIERRYAQIGGVYPACVMKSTEKLLAGGRLVSIPGDIRSCVETAYQDISDDEMNAAVKQMMKDQLSVCEAKSELLPSPKSNRFFAETTNIAKGLCMMDADEDSFLRGAKTRDGAESQRFIFLPRDFPERTEDVEWLKRAMTYSCSIAIKKTRLNENEGLTKRHGQAIMIKKGNKKEKDENKERGTIILREAEDGLYRWGDVVYSCSEEYGIEEVSI